MSKNIDIHTAITRSAKKCFIDQNPTLQDWFLLPDKISVLQGSPFDAVLRVWTQQYMKTNSTLQLVLKHDQKVNFLICLHKIYDFLGLAFTSNKIRTKEICCHCWQQWSHERERLKCFPIFKNINKWFRILLFDFRDDLLATSLVKSFCDILFATCFLVERPVIMLINQSINRDTLI